MRICHGVRCVSSELLALLVFLSLLFISLNLCCFCATVSTLETPSRSLASRERIYKSNDVAGPASAISSLSHKLKGGYACQCGEVVQKFLL